MLALSATAPASGSTDGRLALLIGLAVLALLLLLLLPLLVLAAVLLRRRRRRKDDEHEVFDCSSSTTTTTTTESVVDPPNSSSSSSSNDNSSSNNSNSRSNNDDDVAETVSNGRRNSRRAPSGSVAERLRAIIAAGAPWTARGRRVSSKNGGSGSGGSGQMATPGGGTIRGVSATETGGVGKLSGAGPGGVPAGTAPSGDGTRRRRDASARPPSAIPLPGLGPERPSPAGPTGRHVYIPADLHREPRGWAPASHAVPAPVKRTWGRAKAKQAAQQTSLH